MSLVSDTLYSGRGGRRDDDRARGERGEMHREAITGTGVAESGRDFCVVDGDTVLHVGIRRSCDPLNPGR